MHLFPVISMCAKVNLGRNSSISMVVWSTAAVEAVGKLPTELSVEDRNLLSVAYKNAVGSRHAAWHIITSVEQKEKTKGTCDAYLVALVASSWAFAMRAMSQVPAPLPHGGAALAALQRERDCRDVLFRLGGAAVMLSQAKETKHAFLEEHRRPGPSPHGDAALVALLRAQNRRDVLIRLGGDAVICSQQRRP